MTGHGSTSSMIQMLRTAGASSQVLEVCRHFSCETCRKRQKVQRPPTVKEPNRLAFNYEVSGDCFEVHDSVGNRHTIMSIICLGTPLPPGILGSTRRSSEEPDLCRVFSSRMATTFWGTADLHLRSRSSQPRQIQRLDAHPRHPPTLCRFGGTLPDWSHGATRWNP